MAPVALREHAPARQKLEEAWSIAPQSLMVRMGDVSRELGVATAAGVFAKLKK